MTYKVRVAGEAKAQLRSFGEWWSQNRPVARPTFKDAVQTALEALSVFPSSYPRYRDRDVRFCVIDKTPYLMLFKVDESRRVVSVVTVWSAALGEAPE